MDKHKILNAASVLFQNIFTYFTLLEEAEAKLKTPTSTVATKEEVKNDKA